MADLPQVLIRNNKYCVTDLRGARMFREPEVITTTYQYSPAEHAFYTMMTEFVASGRAYATSLSGQQGRAVMLVLTALQKLASSSVLAVRKALVKRLAKMRGIEAALRNPMPPNSALQIGPEPDCADDGDEQNRLIEDQIVIRALELMNGECSRLEELIAAADEVQNETKVEAILDVVRSLPESEPVLFFTEYKSTQALLISALWRDFGQGCVSFINGDEALPAVLQVDGSLMGIGNCWNAPRPSLKMLCPVWDCLSVNRTSNLRASFAPHLFKNETNPRQSPACVSTPSFGLLV